MMLLLFCTPDALAADALVARRLIPLISEQRDAIFA